MSIRKYYTEFALTMVSDCPLLLQQGELKSIAEICGKQHLIDNPYHIYMIARRPRIRFQPNSLTIQNNILTGVFEIEKKGVYKHLSSFKCPIMFPAIGMNIECEFPYTELKIVDSNNKAHFRTNAAILLTFLSYGLNKKLNLEVIYIGQSFGEDGDRTAPDRLINHSTLQEIYFDCLSKSPDHDIWLILWNFKPTLLSTMGGSLNSYQVSIDEDLFHVDTVINNLISEQQMINYTEAALIRYFEPIYNDKFKYNFPNPAHSSYSQCYDIELNALCVELFTEDFKCSLWSPKIKPHYEHLIKFELFSKEDRKGLFDFF